MYGKGNVKVIYKGTEIKADEVRFNVKSSELEANGNITVTEGDTIITGESVIFNMKGKVGRIERMELSKVPWFFKGKAIEKPDEKNASIIEGYATTCKDTGHPHYRLVSHKIHIEIDNIIESWDVLLYIGDIPVFYFPYIWRSLKASGKSPLTLRPGYSSSEGLFLKLAYNYDFSEYFSGALILDLMTKKGSGYGLQQNYRFADGLNGGYLYAYYILEKDTMLERYRLDFDHSSRINNVSLVARLNYLSDETLTRDFYSYYYPVVSRDIRSYLAATYYDNIFTFMLAADRRDHYFPFEKTYKLNIQTLPDIRFNTTSLRIGETNAYWSIASELINYSSSTGDFYYLQPGLQSSLNYYTNPAQNGSLDNIIAYTQANLYYTMKLDQINSLSASVSLNANAQNRLVLMPGLADSLSNLNYSASLNLHTTWNMNLDTDLNYSYSQNLFHTEYDFYKGILFEQVNGRLNIRLGTFLSSTMTLGYDLRSVNPDYLQNFSNFINSTNLFISQEFSSSFNFQYSMASSMLASFDVFANYGKPQGTRVTFGVNYIRNYPADILDLSGSVAFNVSEDMRIEYGTRYNTTANDFREHRLVFSTNLTDCWYGDITFAQSYGIFSFGFNLQLRAFKESALDKKLAPEVFKY